MKKRVLRATPFQADSLLKGVVLPENTVQVLGVMASGSVGKVDVLLVQEYDIEEPA